MPKQNGEKGEIRGATGDSKERRSQFRQFLDTLGLRSKGKQEAHHPFKGIKYH